MLTTLFFFIGVVGIGLLMVGFASLAHSRQLHKVEKVVSEFGGRCLPTGFWSLPAIEFFHNHFRYRLELPNLRSGPHTQVTVVTNWGKGIRCEVYPQNEITKLRVQLRGLEDVTIGTPHFDDRYIIHTNDTRTCAQLLNASAQRDIEQLRSLAYTDEIYLLLCRGELTIKKRGAIRSQSVLIQFAKLACQLVEDASTAWAEGIEFSETKRAAEWQEAFCQVCGDDISTEGVVCRRCKTPHHADCWQYFGGCSTYGCGETENE